MKVLSRRSRTENTIKRKSASERINADDDCLRSPHLRRYIRFSLSDVVLNLLHFPFSLSHFVRCSCQPYLARPFHTISSEFSTNKWFRSRACSSPCAIRLPNNHELWRYQEMLHVRYRCLLQ